MTVPPGTAQSYAALGRAEEADAAYRRAGFAHPEWIQHDPDLDFLRDDPRFHALLDED